MTADGYTWTVRGTDTIPSCSSHATGKAQAYLKAHACSQAIRSIITTVVGGRTVIVTRAAISLPPHGAKESSFTNAEGYVSLISGGGAGGLKDLFAEGVRYPGGPAALPSPSALSVTRQDIAAIVIQAAYADGTSSSSDPALVAVAKAAITLPVLT